MDGLSQHMQHHSLAGIHMDDMRLSFKIMHCHPQAVGHRKGCDETALQNNVHVTHSLFVRCDKIVSCQIHANSTHFLPVMGNMQCH
jgi:hypothetical protein